MPKFAKSLRLNNLTTEPNAIANETVIYATDNGIQEKVVSGSTAFDKAGFVRTINFSDTFPLSLGICINDLSISEVSIEVITPFSDSGTAITVGDAIDGSRLMDSASNDPTSIGKYTHDVDYKYATDTEVFLYVAGANISGQAIVRLYFN